jgi:hypothetical protein
VAGFYVLRLTGSFSSWRSTWGGVGIGEVRGVEDGHALGQMSVVAANLHIVSFSLFYYFSQIYVHTSNELAGAGMNRNW